MVLAHSGSSDITQSTLASQKVTAKAIRKAIDKRTFLRVCPTLRSVSCRREFRTIAAANPIHTATYIAARRRKNGRWSQNDWKPPCGGREVHGYVEGWHRNTTARSAAPTGRIIDMASGTRRKAMLQPAPHANWIATNTIPAR